MSTLSLGPIEKIESVRFPISMPTSVKADLDRYAELYSQAFGRKITGPALVPHIVATFLAKDREFQKNRRAESKASSSQPKAIHPV